MDKRRFVHNLLGGGNEIFRREKEEQKGKEKDKKGKRSVRALLHNIPQVTKPEHLVPLSHTIGSNEVCLVRTSYLLAVPACITD